MLLHIRGIDSIKGDFDIPNIAYTPYAIFSGKIPLLDINFISPVKQEKVYSVKLRSGERLYITANNKDEVMEKLKDVKVIQNDEDVITDLSSQELGMWMNGLYQTMNSVDQCKSELTDEDYNKIKENANDAIKRVIIYRWVGIDGNEYEEEKTFSSYDEFEKFMEGVETTVYFLDNEVFGWKINKKTTDIRQISDAFSKFNEYVSEINNNKGLNIARFEFTDFGTTGNSDVQLDSSDILDMDDGMVSSAEVLHDIIAGWYVTLRTIALVGLLSVLVYIGIRILLTASAEDKAKYKKLFIDWFVALCLIFVLHYIMSFTLKITEKCVEIFSENSTETILCELPVGISADMDGTGEKKELKNGYIYGATDGTTANGLEKLKKNDGQDSESGRPYLLTNFVGYLRLGVNLYSVNGRQAISSLVMYTVVIIFTVVFTFQYLKRVFIMAFLTLIAPLVALTYPIDRIKDGSAQAFNFWLREYIFNALIQVIHLLIYTTVVSSVYELAVAHPVYALVALGSIIPMEKLVRKMFGFEKAGTVGTFATAASAGMLMNGIKGITRVIGGGRPKPPAKGGGSSKEKMPNIWTHKNDNKAGLDDVLLGGEGIENAAETVSNVASSTAGANSSKGATSKVTSNTSGKGNAAQVNTVGKKPNIVSRAGSKIKTKVLGTSDTEEQKAKINKAKSGLKTFGRRSVSGFKAMGSQFYRRNLKGRNPIRTMEKLGATAAGAAVGAGIGLTLGVATGDPSKVATFAGGLATTIGGAAGNLYDKGYGAAEDYLDTYSNAYHYDDEEYWNKQRVKEFSSDSNNMTELRNRYSGEEMKYIKENIIPTVVGEEGINDISDICAISDMVMKDGMDLNESVAIAKASNKVGSLSSAKAKKEAMDTISQNYAKKLGISDIRMQVESEIKKLNQPQKPKDIPASANRKVRNKYKLDMKEYEKQKNAYDKQVEEIERPLRERERMVKDLTTQHTNKISSYQKRKK